MDTPELKHRTFQFSLRILNLIKALPQGAGMFRLGDQIFGSATSIGANYRSALKAKSKKDFIHKIATVVEEADETCYWLELIIHGEILPKEKVQDLLNEAHELTAIFASTLKTARQNLNS
ncbi:four helix bundle protein [Rubritalea tangerina]|uniref:Four helix bundle protein n=2 Tax=Rubritalea tangerina TaxID=430798 RepID=A0ABW4Z8C5_9BACT